jgi:ribose transport system substrate-binding protein
MSPRSGLTRPRVALLLVICTGVVAGCGGDDDSTTTSSGTAKGTRTAAAAHAELDALINGEGYKSPPPGPAAQPDKRVWVLSCSEATTNCSVAAASAMEAGKALGWKMTLFDVKFDPARAVQGVRQAIAAKADGIVTYLSDCAPFKQALSEARKAGVKTSTAESLDCPTPLYDAIVSYSQGPFPDWLAKWGGAQATAAIAATDGKAKAIVPYATDVPTSKLYFDGVKAGLDKCSDCETYPVEITTADFGAGVQQKVGLALVKHPDANAIILAADALLSGGVHAALRSSGRADDIALILGEGDPAVMSGLRDGKIKGTGIGIPEDWEGYSSIDNLNRLFAGKEPAGSGIGLQAFDTDNNVPHSGGYAAPIDFRQAYNAAWSAGE